MVYNIGLLGLGTVGSGVVQILQTPQQRHRLIASMQISRVAVRSLDKPRDVGIPASLLTIHPEKVVTDPEIDIVVELMGGLEPARSLILQAIQAGKHVVTANKAVIARYGAEIFRAAEARGVYVLLEGAVGGGIPIIQSLSQSLAANRLQSIQGIINGTTNFILSQMSQSQTSYEEALQIAQQRGYAEADPTADVDGWDAVDKIAILASLGFSAQIDRDAILCEGIRSVTDADIRYAREWGFVIKLLGIAQRYQPTAGAGGDSSAILDVRVHPALLPLSHPLASVHQVDNAILVQGDPLGQVMLVGPGAGRGATASAVVSDLLLLLAQLPTTPSLSNPLLRFPVPQAVVLQKREDWRSEFYVRLIAQDQPGVIGVIGSAFGRWGVSLECIMQKASHEATAEIVILTHTVSEANFQQAIEQIRQQELILSIASVLRVQREVVADY
ncbi:MAG: homoserine dehydrogenase [Cyanobacteriota bacterium]|nr:homoserine dehydrogenase [Cyanobacteriota bacterium]